jgi:hypothetical protein
MGTMLFSSRKTQMIDSERALPGRDMPMRDVALASRESYQAELTAAGHGEISTEIAEAGRSTTPRNTTSSTSPRTRTGTAGSAAPA